jgi:tRNA(adenine34) deaminase
MDALFMQQALALARQAAEDGEVPVGAVVVRGDRIVGRGRNRREGSKNALSHAEIEAIDEACRTLGGWRLWDCTLYVTLEPCPMCAGAILNARLQRVVFGARDPKAGSLFSVQRMFDLPYNHKPQIDGGFMQEECGAVLRDFFEDISGIIFRLTGENIRKFSFMFYFQV